MGSLQATRFGCTLPCSGLDSPVPRKKRSRHSFPFENHKTVHPQKNTMHTHTHKKKEKEAFAPSKQKQQQQQQQHKTGLPPTPSKNNKSGQGTQETAQDVALILHAGLFPASERLRQCVPRPPPFWVASCMTQIGMTPFFVINKETKNRPSKQHAGFNRSSAAV